MDSLTHIAIGACISEAVLSKQIGKKALTLGAVTHSLPDIDIVVPFGFLLQKIC
jgi:inner membrane protein